MKLYRNLEIEYIGIRPHFPVGGPGGATLTNLIISTPIGTNLLVADSHRADLLLPIPKDGDTWNVQLEFAPAGLQTKFREILAQQGRWSRSLPSSLRGIPVHFVTQPITATPANQEVQPALQEPPHLDE